MLEGNKIWAVAEPVRWAELGDRSIVVDNATYGYILHYGNG